MRRVGWYAGILGSAAFLGLALPPAMAYPWGISGYSGNPASNLGAYCTECHSGGIVPAVSIAGPALVTSGSMNAYQLRITGGQSIAGGLDVSADGGTLIASDPGTDTQSGGGVGTEITHTKPRDAVAGRVVFNFTWQAPATPGTYTIYGAGNSVNLASGPSGDNAATTSFQVTVEGAAGMPGETSEPTLQALLATAYDNVTGNISVSFQTGCDTDDNNIYYGPLSQVSTLGYSGEVCAVGTAGTAVFDPGAGSFFFLVVGNYALDEGSYGRASGSAERTPFLGNLCGEAQDLSASCTP